jgi:sulfate permease, SulP family
MPDGSSTAHLYRPKLLTTLGEGYSLGKLRQDAVAGLTVAVVALPLSMAIAVASGVTPERGLFTAIVGGFLVSAAADFKSAARQAPSSCWWRQPPPSSASMVCC